MYYKSLVQCLKKLGYLYLPGIGTLRLNSAQSIVNSASQEVSKEPSELRLIENESIQFDAQIQFLSEYWETEPIRTRAALNQLSARINQACANKQAFEFPGMGRFNCLDNKIQFESSGQLELSQHYFERSWTLNKAFQVQNNQSDVLEVAAPDTWKDEDYIVIRPKYYRWIAASLLFFCLSLIGISMWDQANNSFIKPVRYNLDSSEYSMEQINRSPETDGSEKNIDHVLSKEDSVDLLTSENEDTPVQANAIIDSTESVVEQQVTVEENTVEECIYILGSFSNQANANKMKRKIEQLDLKVYKAPFNGNTRIGVLIPCGNLDQLHQIKSLEENYWLLEK